MNEFSKHVGLDVHKATIAVAVADSGRGQARFVGEIPNTRPALLKLVRQLAQRGARLAFCYEAGPCGYEVYRQLRELGQACDVVAPSLIPKRVGDRVKTDRRDALTLVRLHRAGELTPVWVPNGDQEALRDLTRAREDHVHLARQAKQRLLAFLLRHGRRYEGRSAWTQAHFNWLQTLKFAHPTQQIVFQEYLDTLLGLRHRVTVLDAQIATSAREAACWPLIEGLMALRGLSLLGAATIVAELGDLQRFQTAPQLMAYLGMVPSEHSSGAKHRRGAITKTGNGHVRRVLVEAAWTYRHLPRKSPELQRRSARTSHVVQEIAWAAQKRLSHRYRYLQTKGKLKVQACTAVARELAGFIWAIGQVLPRPALHTTR